MSVFSYCRVGIFLLPWGTIMPLQIWDGKSRTEDLLRLFKPCLLFLKFSEYWAGALLILTCTVFTPFPLFFFTPTSWKVTVYIWNVIAHQYNLINIYETFSIIQSLSFCSGFYSAWYKVSPVQVPGIRMLFCLLSHQLEVYVYEIASPVLLFSFL